MFLHLCVQKQYGFITSYRPSVNLRHLILNASLNNKVVIVAVDLGREFDSAAYNRAQN